ncbi:MAG: PilZ domain-containing protein [Alphaproteobacteria bacterium]
MHDSPIETTVYSISAEPPAANDRRSGERHLTLFRVGTLIFDKRRELCLVKNISAGGALVRAYCALKPGQRLKIELKEHQPVAGNVGWVRGTDVGITFDKQVDVAELLKAAADGPRPRMPRLEVNGVCFVREGAILNRATIRNVSQGGLNVESSSPLTTGAEVTVTIPGLPPQAARVRWNDGERYGISFNTVLPLAGLVEWLHSRECS